MIVILDASTLINLVNGGVLSEVLNLPDHRFLVSGVVRNESRSVAAAVDVAVSTDKLGLVDDGVISANAFREAKREMQLDDGETECILAAQAMACAIGCDDRAARAFAKRELGEASLTGSIGLLRQAVVAGLITQSFAFASYKLMVARGGYLPTIDEAGF